MRKVVLLIFLLALVSGCVAAPAAEEPTPTPLPTAIKPTYTVELGDMVIKTEIGGRVTPKSSKPVSFAMDGNVGNVYVAVGDYVEEGQLLADLDVLKDLENQWAEASAAAKYEETISNDTIKRAEIKLQIAQLTVDDLKAKGASATALQIAELQAELAQMDLDEIKANPTLHTAAAKVQDLERQMAAAQLNAPFAGYIIEAPNPGRAVKQTTAAFQIGDISQLEIGANVLEEDLQQLTEGMTVTVVFEGKPDKTAYTGTIRELPFPYGSGKNGNTEARIQLNVSPEQAGYQLGDRVLITAVLQEKHNIPWLPPAAIRTVGGHTFVVLQDGKREDVTLGLQTHDRVEITSGLTAGQVVIGP